MYNDQQSLKVFQAMHVRDVMVEEAHHVADRDNVGLVGSHLFAELEGQRLMSVLGLAAVLGLILVVQLIF